MFDLKPVSYVDYNVSTVMSIKKKYGFRVTLKYSDGSTRVIQRAGFSTKREANKERDKALGQLTTNTFDTQDILKVDKYLNEWLEQVMRPKITYASYMSYKNAIKHINTYLGDLNLLTLKPSSISSMYKDYSEISLDVTKLMRVVLKTSMDYAVRLELLQENPALRATFPKVRNNKKSAEIVLTEEQLKLLMEASKETPIHLHVMFACLLGLRKSEINGLRFSDIDYVNNTITIQRQIGKKLTKTEESLSSSTKDAIPLKTFSSNRTLPLPDVLLEVILEEKENYERKRSRRNAIFQDYGYICCCYNGSPRTRGYVYKHYKKLLKQCNLPDIKWHTLRKSYCTMLMSQNFNPKAISALMGHSREIVTADVYHNKIQVYSCLEQLEPLMAELLEQTNNKVDVLPEETTTEVLNITEKLMKEYGI